MITINDNVHSVRRDARPCVSTQLRTASCVSAPLHTATQCIPRMAMNIDLIRISTPEIQYTRHQILKIFPIEINTRINFEKRLKKSVLQKAFSGELKLSEPLIKID